MGGTNNPPKSTKLQKTLKTHVVLYFFPQKGTLTDTGDGEGNFFFFETKERTIFLNIVILYYIFYILCIFYIVLYFVFFFIYVPIIF